MTSLSIPELCKLSSLRNSWRAIILAGRLGRDKLGDKLRNKGDKTSGRRAHHPTKGNKKEDKLVHKLGDKLEDKLENKLGDKADKTSGRRAHHPTKGNKKEDKLVHKLGDKRDKDSGRKGEGGHAIQQRETRRNKLGDKLGGGHTIQERETGMETSWETSW